MMVQNVTSNMVFAVALGMVWSPSVLTLQAAGISWSSGCCHRAATSRGVL